MARRTDHQIAVDDALTKDLNRGDAVHDFPAGCTAELHRRFARSSSSIAGRCPATPKYQALNSRKAVLRELETILATF